MTTWLGLDLGGTGGRLTIRTEGSDRRLDLHADGVAVTSAGSTAPIAAAELLTEARSRWPEAFERLVGAGIGSSGLSSLVPDPARMLRDLAELINRGRGDDAVPVALAPDAITAHLGALGGGPGVVVALGTGAITVGGDGHSRWHRVDGWGHLLGDRGSGAWIGLRGLDAAVRTHDGLDDRGSALLAAAQRRYGPVSSWPSQLYQRDDRAGILARFARDIAELAERGDATAVGIMTDAGREAALSAIAASDPRWGSIVAPSGGVFDAGGALVASFTKSLVAARPDVAIRPPIGDPLEGALRLAQRAEHGLVDSPVPGVLVRR